MECVYFGALEQFFNVFPGFYQILSACVVFLHVASTSPEMMDHQGRPIWQACSMVAGQDDFHKISH